MQWGLGSCRWPGPPWSQSLLLWGYITNFHQTLLSLDHEQSVSKYLLCFHPKNQWGARVSCDDISQEEVRAGPPVMPPTRRLSAAAWHLAQASDAGGGDLESGSQLAGPVGSQRQDANPPKGNLLSQSAVNSSGLQLLKETDLHAWLCAPLLWSVIFIHGVVCTALKVELLWQACRPVPPPCTEWVNRLLGVPCGESWGSAWLILERTILIWRQNDAEAQGSEREQ